MFDEPQEDPTEQSSSPANRAKEKADEFRMHAELAAVFEGNRKFGAEIVPGLDPQVARDTQRGMGRLEKAKSPDSPVLPAGSIEEAAGVLKTPDTRSLSTNDYHVYRRPGEVMIVRWLAGDQVETFYERIQAHFDAAMTGFREEERQSNEWKQDPQTLAYLDALDALEVKMEERYLRELIRKTGIFVLSTQAADEMNIAYLCDYLMGVPAAEVVGSVSAPPDEPTERDLAWFFKLFSLRGMVEGTERMCFFAYLQKSDDDFDLE
ncbi:MAG TPA: hypothetical protein VK797_00280 [Tepidisphaeraceae bacterium]|jgi:hypothetical protein|nr:hypothetical protein [Tepidisphaeraceae bacterium]